MLWQAQFVASLEVAGFCAHSRVTASGLAIRNLGPLFLQSGFPDAVFHYMLGFCRDFVVKFAVVFSVIFCSSFEGMEGPFEIHRKIHTKIHDKIHTLRMIIHHDERSAEGQS